MDIVDIIATAVSVAPGKPSKQLEKKMTFKDTALSILIFMAVIVPLALLLSAF